MGSKYTKFFKRLSIVPFKSILHNSAYNFIQDNNNVTEEFTKLILNELRHRCDCTLPKNEVITKARILCPLNQSDHLLLYRAQLNGTTEVSVHLLVSDLQTWVDSQGKIKVADRLIEVQSSCNLTISSFEEDPCPASSIGHKEKHEKMKPEVISGITLAIAFFIGMLIAVAVIILLRRKADKSIIEAM